MPGPSHAHPPAHHMPTPPHPTAPGRDAAAALQVDCDGAAPPGHAALRRRLAAGTRPLPGRALWHAGDAGARGRRRVAAPALPPETACCPHIIPGPGLRCAEPRLAPAVPLHPPPARAATLGAAWWSSSPTGAPTFRWPSRTRTQMRWRQTRPSPRRCARAPLPCRAASRAAARTAARLSRSSPVLVPCACPRTPAPPSCSITHPRSPTPHPTRAGRSQGRGARHGQAPGQRGHEPAGHRHG